MQFKTLSAIAISLPLMYLFGCNAKAVVDDQGAGGMTGDIGSLSDDFDDPAKLSNWQRIERVEGWGADQLEQFDIGGRKKGWMTMIPYTSTWYQDYRGVLAFKSVFGDFVVTTHLSVSARNGSGAPKSQFSLCGIMVRAARDLAPSTWRPGGENYVFLSLGAADQAGHFQFEVKTTVNSNSQLTTEPTSGGDATIRVARIGSAMIMMKKVDGLWTVHRRFHRGDFPPSLQVGLTCYTDWPNASRIGAKEHNGTVIRSGSPDLLALIDYVHYSRPQVPGDLEGRNLSDPSQASDSQLLAFLGSD